jgi:glutaminyl-peptide cyclotransferase
VKPATQHVLKALRSRAALAWSRARMRATRPSARIEAIGPSALPPAGAWPVDVPAGAGPDFDGGRAFALLRAQCAVGPRIPGTEPHRRTRDLLLAELARWTDEVAVQRWEQPVWKGAGAGGRHAMTNVFGRIRGTAVGGDGPPHVMVCAHWDTRPVADADPDPALRALPVPGASDGASGTAVVLELARALHAARPASTVSFALFDGEDLGEHYYGSRVFAPASRRPGSARWSPRGAVVLDMVGGHGVRCTTEIQSVSRAAALWNRVHASADALGLDRHFHGPARVVNDDHVFLGRAGIPAIVLIDYSYPHWHTTADVPERCSAASLRAVGRVMLHFVRSLVPA